jgi:hypothetical protein
MFSVSFTARNVVGSSFRTAYKNDPETAHMLSVKRNPVASLRNYKPIFAD